MQEVRQWTTLNLEASYLLNLNYVICARYQDRSVRYPTFPQRRFQKRKYNDHPPYHANAVLPYMSSYIVRLSPGIFAGFSFFHWQHFFIPNSQEHVASIPSCEKAEKFRNDGGDARSMYCLQPSYQKGLCRR